MMCGLQHKSEYNDWIFIIWWTFPLTHMTPKAEYPSWDPPVLFWYPATQCNLSPINSECLRVAKSRANIANPLIALKECESWYVQRCEAMPAVWSRSSIHGSKDSKWCQWLSSYLCRATRCRKGIQVWSWHSMWVLAVPSTQLLQSAILAACVLFAYLWSGVKLF